MSGELVAIEVENTTDQKISRAGRIFLPKATRVVEVTPNGVIEIRACKGLIVTPSDGSEEEVASEVASEEVEPEARPKSKR